MGGDTEGDESRGRRAASSVPSRIGMEIIEENCARSKSSCTIRLRINNLYFGKFSNLKYQFPRLDSRPLEIFSS